MRAGSQVHRLAVFPVSSLRSWEGPLPLLVSSWRRNRAQRTTNGAIFMPYCSCLICREQVLGEGAFGDVVLAVEKKSGQRFAVKKMLKVHLDKESSKKFVMMERNALSKINHPNIVKLYSAFRDDEYFCTLFLRDFHPPPFAFSPSPQFCIGCFFL